MSDATNPKHYRQGGIQPIDFIEANNLGFNAGNVIKYVTRAKFKNGAEDIRKAQWYLARHLKEIEAAEAKAFEMPAGYGPPIVNQTIKKPNK